MLMMNPAISDGSTSIMLSRKIIYINPVLLNPTILMTPNSKVFDSTLIMRSEYIKSILYPANNKSIKSNISPKNIVAKEYNSSAPSISKWIFTLKKPRVSIISFE